MSEDGKEGGAPPASKEEDESAEKAKQDAAASAVTSLKKEVKDKDKVGAGFNQFDPVLSVTRFTV
jgi:hypothetical protein